MTIKDRVWGLLAGEECYVVLDKGPIVDSHVLVLPVEHYPSQLSLSASSFAEMERYLSALSSCFAYQVTSCSYHAWPIVVYYWGLGPGNSSLPQLSVSGPRLHN